jgi:superfamily II DNA or RNA helicase
MTDRADSSHHGLAHIEALITDAEERLAALERERAGLVEFLASLRRQRAVAEADARRTTGPVPADADSRAALVSVMRRVFRGREDVYARRWESPKTGRSGYSPVCGNEWLPGTCAKPRVKCAECLHRSLLPLTDEVIRRHVFGDARSREGPRDPARETVIGVYPLLTDETCWFLAADFDGAAWQDDATAFLETCLSWQVPAALERSRSGKGGHVWIFFTESIPAALARRLGSFLLTQTMERRPQIGLRSYDRLFPNQDTMPQGGFGNLIALPLQCGSWAHGNSVFVDEEFRPHENQLAFLSSRRPMSRGSVETIVAEAQRLGGVVGVRLPVTDEEDEEPWVALPSRRPKEPVIGAGVPTRVKVVLSNQVYIAKDGLPPALINRLVRIAAFQNPEFYAAQAMRLSVFGKPRIISCAEDYPHHIGLPRGCLDEAVDLLVSLGAQPDVEDKREPGVPLEVGFGGDLRPQQQEAARALLAHETGVLAAATAFGKTVVAAHVIATRAVNTLVLVHRQQLLEQWRERLAAFLDLDARQIGQIGAGKRRPTGVIDVALLQSLCRKGVVDDVVGQYGHLVVDECHHLPAQSFEQVARRCKMRYVTGLSATTTRKDGHHPIIFMQCGPMRYRVSAKQQAAQRPFDHRVLVRPTVFRFEAEAPAIQDLYAALMRDEARNGLIMSDVEAAVAAGRSPVVLTERTEHVQMLAESLHSRVPNVITMRGGMGVRQRRAVAEQLAAIPDGEPRLLIATGRYLGEGFDDARLDTLFLALPISWRGTLTQYAGRLHRLHGQKTEVVIYDYADLEVPMLARMHERRLRGYRAIGYRVETAPGG